MLLPKTANESNQNRSDGIKLFSNSRQYIDQENYCLVKYKHETKFIKLKEKENKTKLRQKKEVRDYLIECKDKCLLFVCFFFLHSSQNKGADHHKKCAKC